MLTSFPMSKRKKKKKKQKCKDFPNDWLFYKKLKPKNFMSVPYQDFIEERVNCWELVPGVLLVARAHNLVTGQIYERAFTSVKEVNKFMRMIDRSGEPHHVHCFDSGSTFTALFHTDD